MGGQEIANFFWHGVPLSVYERACVGSFVAHGFDVRMWCYQPIDTPAGVGLRDAAEILPLEDLSRYTQQGQPRNVAAFTDFFRYELLSRHPGWWFDTDVLCLQDADAFKRFNGAGTVGREADDLINGAVLQIQDATLARRLKAKADAVAQASGNSFRWGAVGPILVTEMLAESPGCMDVVQQSAFYPIGWREALLVLDPARAEECASRCQGALAYHVWNEVIRRALVPKCVLPPEGSFLHDAFLRAAPELRSTPALPAETLRALAERLSPVDPGFMHHVRCLGPSLWNAVRKHL